MPGQPRQAGWAFLGCILDHVTLAQFVEGDLVNLTGVAVVAGGIIVLLALDGEEGGSPSCGEKGAVLDAVRVPLQPVVGASERLLNSVRRIFGSCANAPTRL
jgi:hypothetical protein